MAKDRNSSGDKKLVVSPDLDSASHTRGGAYPDAPMNIIDRLRRAEHQSKEAAREGFERALHSWEDAQTMIRRKMRIYPRSTNQLRGTAPAAPTAPAPVSSVASPQEAAAPANHSSASDSTPAPPSETREEAKPIVSVHGKDIDTEEPAA